MPILKPFIYVCRKEKKIVFVQKNYTFFYKNQTQQLKNMARKLKKASIPDYWK
jgi:hypothetical protein